MILNSSVITSQGKEDRRKSQMGEPLYKAGTSKFYTFNARVTIRSMRFSLPAHSRDEEVFFLSIFRYFILIANSRYLDQGSNFLLTTIILLGPRAPVSL